jgi:DNA (cytosine-5)-methyltransferase 1
MRRLRCDVIKARTGRPLPKVSEDHLRDNDVPDSGCGHGEGPRLCDRGGPEPSWWDAEPAVGRVAHGVAHRVEQLKALGNGQVPLVAATAWGMLMARAAAKGGER